MSRQASPYRAARTAKRELKQKMTAGAAAIMGSITCKGRGDEPDLFMPILRVAALLEQAIAHDPGAISTNLVEQAAESDQGATRLLAAFETVVEQEEMELGTFEIREDPMTEDEMDDAIYHQMATALAASFDATDGSESSLVLLQYIRTVPQRTKAALRTELQRTSQREIEPVSHLIAHHTIGPVPSLHRAVHRVIEPTRSRKSTEQ